MQFTTDAFRRLCAAETAPLLDQLGTLTAEQWSAPTACEGWDVLDILVHLNLGVDLHATMHENGLTGRAQPPWDLPPDVNAGEQFKQRHQRERAKGPAANRVAYQDATRRYAAVLDKITDGDLDRPTWFWGQTVPLSGVMSARLWDTILHRADIRRALGVQPAFSSKGGAFSGRFVTENVVHFFVPSLADGATGTVRQTIDGVDSSATLSVDGLKVGPGAGASDAALTTDGGTWTLLAWRRLPVADAVTAGTLSVEGDQRLIEQYLGALKTP